MIKTFYVDKEITTELATELQGFIDSLELDDEVVFYFNSNGGSVVSGMAMYDSISAMKQKTCGKVIGMCASAATYPCLACDSVEMAKNATMMIHPVSGGLYGTIEQIEKDLDYMAELEGRMIAIYAAKATYSNEKEIRCLVANTTYMSAQQALDLGFVDSVEGLERQERCEVENNVEAEPVNKVEDEGFVNKILTLAGLKAKGEIIHAPVDEVDVDALKAEIKDLKDMVNANEMTIQHLSDSLDVKQAEFDATVKAKEDEIVAVENRLNDEKQRIEDAVKAEVANRLAALGYQVEELPANHTPKELKCDAYQALMAEMGL